MDYMKWAGIVTAALAPLPALIQTIRNLCRRKLDEGGRRPEPTIAALLANATWLLFGYTESQGEPLGLNAWGGFVQALGLVTFVCLCTRGERARAWPLGIAALYFGVTVAFGSANHRHLQTYQWLCAIAGMVAAAAPLLTFVFLIEDKRVELLPPWQILVCNIGHGCLWVARGWMLKPKNKYMISQNGAGAVSSFLQLLIVLCLPAPGPRIEQDSLRQSLLGGLDAPAPAPARHDLERASPPRQPPGPPKNVSTITGNEGASTSQTRLPSAPPENGSATTGNEHVPAPIHPAPADTPNITSLLPRASRSARTSRAAASTPGATSNRRSPRFTSAENVEPSLRRSLRLGNKATTSSQTEGTSGGGSRSGMKTKLEVPKGRSRGVKRKKPATDESSSSGGEGGNRSRKKQQMS